MKHEEYRQSTPSDGLTPLPEFETKPCYRGVMDVEHYERTGEIVMIEPFEEYVPPTLDDDVTSHDHMARRRLVILNPNKPKKEVLDKDLDDGMSISMIAEKYGCHVSTVHSWIKGYGLTGVKGRSKGANKDKTTQAETKQAEEKLMGIIAGAKTKENVSPEISESGPNASPETQAPQTIGGVWENLRLDLVALKRLYVADARKAFKEQLDAMLSEVMEGQAND